LKQIKSKQYKQDSEPGRRKDLETPQKSNEAGPGEIKQSKSSWLPKVLREQINKKKLISKT
jgi:hypothetical protein